MSKRWFQAHQRDTWRRQARSKGYRARSAFKLKQIQEKFHLIREGDLVFDVGCHPGGWTQVAVNRVKADQPRGGMVVAADINSWEEVRGATCTTIDFLDPEAPDRLKLLLGGSADIVLSDMAAPTTGHGPTDHLRIIGLAEAAWEFATDVLTPGGVFICKVFQGGMETELLREIKKRCEAVRHAKPPASRSDSAEVYLVATGFDK